MAAHDVHPVVGAVNDKTIIEAKLRQHDGNALGDPGHTVQHIAEQIAAALRESRKADVAIVKACLSAGGKEPEFTTGMRALSRLAGGE